jgi:hypothetical protein
MEILCIDDKFTDFQLNIFSAFGIKTPKYGEIYTVRDVINHVGGEGTGFLLNEIVNIHVPVETPFGLIWRETTWSAKRFCHLDKSPIEKEEIKEIIAELKPID